MIINRNQLPWLSLFLPQSQLVRWFQVFGLLLCALGGLIRRWAGPARKPDAGTLNDD